MFYQKLQICAIIHTKSKTELYACTALQDNRIAHDNRHIAHRDSRTEHEGNGVRPAAAVSARSAVYHQAVGLYIISRKAAYHHGEAVYKKYTAKHGYYKITA